MDIHWPLQFGYFASPHARALPVGDASATSTTAPIKCLQSIVCSLSMAFAAARDPRDQESDARICEWRTPEELVASEYPNLAASVHFSIAYSISVWFSLKPVRISKLD